MFSELKRRLGLRILQKHRSILSRRPLDSSAHYAFAKDAVRYGLYNLANAELKNAEYLGYDRDKVVSLQKDISGSLDEHAELDVNQYQRFYILRAHLQNLLNSDGSILDIGGGHGILTQFVPENSYFLIEPSVNGISGLELPFADNSFDVVITCHVLEHISEEDRPIFINELIRVAKLNVLIFNPFKNDELDEKERLELVLDITKAPWAEEHLDCGLPAIEQTCDYISSQGFSLTVKEYGDIYASLATVFMSYFAGKANAGDIKKINRHLNQKYDQLTSGKYPTNIMIEVSIEE